MLRATRTAHTAMCRSAMDKSVFAKAYRWRIGAAEPSKETRAKSLYYYRRLMLECTEPLDSPLERQRIADELRWMFEQKKNEESKEEIETLHAACEESTL